MPTISTKTTKTTTTARISLSTAGMVGHPVTQVIGEQALVDFWICLRLPGPAGGVSTHSSGLGLRMVKELDLQLALGMNERR